MRFLRDTPIKRKLALIGLLASGAALLVAGMAFVAYDQVAFRRSMIRDLTSTTQVVAFNSAAALAFNDAVSAEHVLKSLRVHPHITAACLYTPTGDVFAGYRRAGSAPGVSWPGAPAYRERFGRNSLEIAQPIELDQQMIGTVYIHSDLAELYERWWRYLGIAGAVVVVGLLTAAGINSWLHRVITGPIAHLASISDRVAAHQDYAVRATKTGNDELGALIDGFNHMLSQIQSRNAALQSAHDDLERQVGERTAALTYARDQLHTLLDASPDAIYFKDQQSRFTLVSRSKVEMALGRLPDLRARRAAKGLSADVPEAELLNGLTDFDTHQDDDARRAFEDEQQIIRTGEAIVGKLERQAFLDGSVRWKLSNKMPWRGREGAIIGTFGISKDVTELKEAEEKLARLHRELIDASREAGMSEIATNVLHNVGNVLNSVNVSVTLVFDQMHESKLVNLSKLAALLLEHSGDLGRFLTDDPRGRVVPRYLATLAADLAEESATIIAELDGLRRNVDHIKEIVTMQQNYATTSGVVEDVAVTELVEDALRLNAGALSHHQIEVVREYQAKPHASVDRHRVLQIFVNLIRNAKYACDESGRQDKRITVRLTCDEGMAVVAIIDNGVGIAAENLTRIFAHGFTTRANGHGFGLHSGALAAQELGGSLLASSDGPGLGATFTLRFPLEPLLS